MKTNISAFARWAIRQTLGTKRGQQVIDALESGLWEALDALRRKDFAAFWEALPDEWQAWVLGELKKKLGLGGIL